MRVINIDPGGTTGITIAAKLPGADKLYLNPMQERLSCKEFYERLKNEVYDFVVCESFEYRQRARAGLDLTPAHLIGIVFALVPEDQLYMQTAATGKAHFSDAKLKTLGIYIPARPHAMDSLRHFMQWYMFGPGYKYYDADAIPTLV